MKTKPVKSHSRSAKLSWSPTGVVSDRRPEQGSLAESPRAYEIAGVMNADEVAAFLRVDRKTIYTAAKEGQLPCLKIGRQLRFSREAVLQTMAQGRNENSNGGSDGSSS